MLHAETGVHTFKSQKLLEATGQAQGAKLAASSLCTLQVNKPTFSIGRQSVSCDMYSHSRVSFSNAWNVFMLQRKSGVPVVLNQIPAIGWLQLNLWGNEGKQTSTILTLPQTHTVECDVCVCFDVK